MVISTMRVPQKGKCSYLPNDASRWEGQTKMPIIYIWLRRAVASREREAAKVRGLSKKKGAMFLILRRKGGRRSAERKEKERERAGAGRRSFEYSTLLPRVTYH